MNDMLNKIFKTGYDNAALFLICLAYDFLFFDFGEGGKNFLFLLTILLYLAGKMLVFFNRPLLARFHENYEITSRSRWDILFWNAILEMVLIPVICISIFRISHQTMIAFTTFMIVFSSLTNTFLYKRSGSVFLPPVIADERSAVSGDGGWARRLFNGICLSFLFSAEMLAVTLMYYWTFEVYGIGGDRYLPLKLFASLSICGLIFCAYALFYRFRLHFYPSMAGEGGLKDKAIILFANIITICITGISAGG